MQNYFTIKGEYEHKIDINRSVFICNLKGVKDFEQGMYFEKTISKKYSDATHNCYAILTIDGRQKFYDDGEPSGTAGQPILQALKNKELFNVVAVVTRYFGGIKLGVGGLVAAYSSAVCETINEAKTIEMALCIKATVDIEYPEINNVMNHFRQTGITVLDTQYSDNVQITFACPINDIEKTEQFIASVTSGKSVINWQQKDFFEKIKPQG